ncbi:hypothetical protein QR680_014049 [Steinernema hermaphroditum]|uniref:Homeobox domain-containing protein n=1 Tax=Steinernema hermaphroditum TaxID=289476 RepID=A0AA39I9L5_9BILA|nr:hypothetical protein QR680_014049 [Steinernema hermaphroditum]
MATAIYGNPFHYDLSHHFRNVSIGHGNISYDDSSEDECSSFNSSVSSTSSLLSRCSMEQSKPAVGQPRKMTKASMKASFEALDAKLKNGRVKKQQREKLNCLYRRGKYVDLSKIDRIAKQLEMTPMAVKAWFQNRRHNEKKKKAR